MPSARQSDGLQLGQVVGGQQPAIGHRDDALDGESLHDLLDDRVERGHLGRVAIEHLVVQRQALGSLHHAEHDLARNQPLLGHAEVAQVAVLLRQATGTDGGHVVEHDGQILID